MVNAGVQKALEGDKNVQLPALRIASARSMEESADKVFELLSSSDVAISEAAYAALAGVVEPKDFSRLSLLLEKGYQIFAVQRL